MQPHHDQVINSTDDFGVFDVLKRGMAGAAACQRRRRGLSRDPPHRNEVTMAARPYRHTRGRTDKYGAFKSIFSQKMREKIVKMHRSSLSFVRRHKKRRETMGRAVFGALTVRDGKRPKGDARTIEYRVLQL